MQGSLAKLNIAADSGYKGKVEFDFSGSDQGRTIKGDVTSSKSYANGTSAVNFDRTQLKRGVYSSLTTKWLASKPAVQSNYSPPTSWNVLGLTRYSQYNTPNESQCSGSTKKYFIVQYPVHQDGRHPCTFTQEDLLSTFATQTRTNGTGASLNFNLLKWGTASGMTLICPQPWPAGATTDNSYVKVSTVTGQCNTVLTPGKSVATVSATCAEQLLLVNGADNTNYGNKAVGDLCPTCNINFAGTQGHIDSYADTHFCDAHRDNVDLGNFWTIQTK